MIALNPENKNKLINKILYIENTINTTIPKFSKSQIESFFEYENYNIFLLNHYNEYNKILMIKNNQCWEININQTIENTVNNEEIKSINLDTLIGFAIFYNYNINDNTSENIIDLFKIVISQEYQKKGLGFLFLKTIIQYYYNIYKNVKFLLEVSENNSHAIQLYKKLGFSNIHIRKKYYLNDNAIIMELTNTSR